MAQLVTQGKEEPVQQLQKTISGVSGKTGASACIRACKVGLPFWGRLTCWLRKKTQKLSVTRLDEDQDLLGITPSLYIARQDSRTSGTKPRRSQLIEMASTPWLRSNPSRSWSLDLGHYRFVSYATAEAVLPADHGWVIKMKKARDEVLAQVGDPDKRGAAYIPPGGPAQTS